MSPAGDMNVECLSLQNGLMTHFPPHSQLQLRELSLVVGKGGGRPICARLTLSDAEGIKAIYTALVRNSTFNCNVNTMSEMNDKNIENGDEKHQNQVVVQTGPADTRHQPTQRHLKNRHLTWIG